ncbi:hypothetical protein O159_22730 [Leifsonia xyli subsp. cynodontis DSM 46306]|uniref:Uncharacterized protein n=1 Tax=Leifsonia xyli subsp. cynodontis DSM 46306 TaxID=1389489 RepID=U3P8B8_LEIXC|nr:hypothetical protein [Leifsonia xyli]AGW41714.1 hypothetical protein O159_16680 [Leifsonia xyli subsp. cynodontis DSM 46306]AGW42237.1 hypothetical protein O159_22730 [Leifsonia xyli subsp. cynodontis DSM 46306]
MNRWTVFVTGVFLTAVVLAFTAAVAGLTLLRLLGTVIAIGVFTAACWAYEAHTGTRERRETDE